MQRTFGFSQRSKGFCVLCGSLHLCVNLSSISNSNTTKIPLLGCSKIFISALKNYCSGIFTSAKDPRL